MPDKTTLSGPVSEWGLEISGDNFRAKIEIASGEPDPGFWHSHQYTMLLESLIERAGTGKWEGSPVEVQPGEFYARMLAAIARHYRVSLPVPPDSVLETLQMLLDEVQDQINGPTESAEYHD